MSWNFGSLHYVKPERFEIKVPGDKEYSEFIELMEQSFSILGYFLVSPPIRNDDHWIVIFKRS